MTKPKRPRDPNQLAKLIAGIATGEIGDMAPDEGKAPAAIERGRKGGLKGGRSRMDALTDAERKELARKAALTRWKKGAPTDGAPKDKLTKQH